MIAENLPTSEVRKLLIFIEETCRAMCAADGALIDSQRIDYYNKLRINQQIEWDVAEYILNIIEGKINVEL